MIGKVTGRVDYVADDHVLLEAAGVGYVIYCDPPTLLALPRSGEIAALYTELVVREDLMQLFGFRSRVDREWHRLLTSVQGVGAKVSLGILGTLGSAGVGRALATSDATAIRAAPGVGPKLATRIATELKGKAPDVMALSTGVAQAAMPVGDGPGGTSPPAAPAAQMAAAPSPNDSELMANAEALSALINLGYDRGEALAAIAGVEPGPVEDVIRRALQALAKEL
ncbi:MAG: Holliday junction branch migration protein RuvA [Pseudomonadota bacterium]